MIVCLADPAKEFCFFVITWSMRTRLISFRCVSELAPALSALFHLPDECVVVQIRSRQLDWIVANFHTLKLHSIFFIIMIE